MSVLQQNDFDQFFFELHGHKPFPWQSRLAELVCKQGWPKVLDLPTASGKTACIDIALFALAVRGNAAPRRIFFVVDRRVIVSEAHERANRMEKKLKNATNGVLKTVANELRRLSGDQQEPLCTYELTGGAFRDETWVRTPLQPAVIASTVDQVGSRLLFRGYGVAEHTWPMHAGLIANDAILFLDEAHCSKAFAGTLEAVERYRSETWATSHLARPFHFVEMTATPTRVVEPKERFTIDSSDRQDEILRKRIFASKPTRLPDPIKCKKDELSKFAAALIEEALARADEADAKRIAIMVNRIGAAKAVHQQLCNAKQNSMLVIGRMRPLDRDFLAQTWKPLKSGVKREPDGQRQFIVSTQCLEVGADLDFDVLVSECASIDALQQRFGRLDRVGDFTRARGAILTGVWQLAVKDGDPVYGDALGKTWDFLQSIARDGVVNMGIEAGDEEKTVAAHLAAATPEVRNGLTLQGESAPMLLPAHLDALAQTSPRPQPEPYVDYFLHGPERGTPDVYVVWRSDLNDQKPADWAEIVELCPPSSAEAMPVPLWAFRKWMQGSPFKDESDTEVTAQAHTDDADPGKHDVLVWDAPEKRSISSDPSKIFPGATVVLPSSTKCWDTFGFKPEACAPDRGDEARLMLRRRICLRLHPRLLEQWNEFPNRDQLKTLVSNSEPDPEEIWSTLEASGAPEFLNIRQWLNKGTLSCYPVGPGWVVEGYFGQKETRGGKTVLLEEHLRHVEDAVDAVVGDLLPTALKRAAKTAAHYHDYGKADIRFQAWLRNGDMMAARYSPKPIAKSGKSITRKQTECGLPQDFRHELLSFLLAEKATDLDANTRDLVLHLVASHHGRCRPFPPLAVDDQPECVQFADVSICGSEIRSNPPFALNRGVADRFWRLTRQYGWWGLAYLEAMLRLADWNASNQEGAETE